MSLKKTSSLVVLVQTILAPKGPILIVYHHHRPFPLVSMYPALSVQCTLAAQRRVFISVCCCCSGFYSPKLLIRDPWQLASVQPPNRAGRTLIVTDFGPHQIYYNALAESIGRLTVAQTSNILCLGRSNAQLTGSEYHICNVMKSYNVYLQSQNRRL